MSPVDRLDIARGRARDPLVRAIALDHLVLETPDRDAAERFYGDFGLSTAARTADALYLRAAGAEHHALELINGARAKLRAVALRVEDEMALRKLASLPRASAIEERRAPGGGKRVRLSGPGGLVVHAVHGIEEVAPQPLRDRAALNGVADKPRVGRPRRLAAAPSAVARLGHAVFDTTRPIATVLWLFRTFGMIASDYQTLDDAPDAGPIVSFLRCDRGTTPTDHHTLAVALGARPGLGHVAFEVEDVDEIGVGARWLASRGWRRAWGIGRHVLGSQVFDYWHAPDGTLVEHYADGDVFDASAPTGHLPFKGSNLLQWGPEPPRGFGLPPFSLLMLTESARSIATSEELTLGLLARAARALSK